jgi:hypothetical protein
LFYNGKYEGRSMPPVTQRPAAAGNYAVGRRQAISRITFHHIAGDAPGAIARFQTPGVEVSSHYIIGSDGTLYQSVAEVNTSFADGNSDSNARTISIEHAGGIAGVPYTEAMYQTSIALVRHLIKKYGITDFKRHRDVIDKTAYPGGTICPGTLDVERIINAAQGEDEMAHPTPQEVVDEFAKTRVYPGPANQAEIDYYTTKQRDVLLQDLLAFNYDRRTEAEQQADKLAGNIVALQRQLADATDAVKAAQTNGTDAGKRALEAMQAIKAALATAGV